MPELYAHERTARRAAEMIESPAAEFPAAFLTGAEGPDPLYYAALWRLEPFRLRFCRLGLLLHTRKCAQLLTEMVLCARTDVQKAYTLGFLTHYALDQVLHPYILAKCRPGEDFDFPGGHAALEQAVDSTLFLKDRGSGAGLEPPAEEFGVFLLSRKEQREVDELLREAVERVYPGLPLARGEVGRAFSRLRTVRKKLAHPNARKRRLFGRPLFRKLGLDGHLVPETLPTCDYMNLSEHCWTEEEQPQIPRRESVYRLLETAQYRAAEYMDRAQEIWDGCSTAEALSKCMAGRSYFSDAPNSAEEEEK